MDTSLFDQVDDALVALFVLVAHVLHQIEKNLPAHHLVPVHPCDITELRFSCRGRRHTGTGSDILYNLIFQCFFNAVADVQCPKMAKLVNTDRIRSI